jgi:hypothetical protein
MLSRYCTGSGCEMMRHHLPDLPHALLPFNVFFHLQLPVPHFLKGILEPLSALALLCQDYRLVHLVQQRVPLDGEGDNLSGTAASRSSSAFSFPSKSPTLASAPSTVLEFSVRAWPSFASASPSAFNACSPPSRPLPHSHFLQLPVALLDLLHLRVLVLSQLLHLARIALSTGQICNAFG